jgi:transposase
LGIEVQIARLDQQLKELARRSQVCWRLMSMPGVGPIVALAFMAAIEDVGRFRRMRDIGAYLGLTPKRYQSGETDVVLGISRPRTRCRSKQTRRIAGRPRATRPGAKRRRAAHLKVLEGIASGPREHRRAAACSCSPRERFSPVRVISPPCRSLDFALQ